MAGLPKMFEERLKKIVKEEFFEQVWQSFHAPKGCTFRVNPLRDLESSVIHQLQTDGFDLKPMKGFSKWQTEVCEVSLDQRRALTEDEAFYEGKIYIQNPSSMAAPMILQPKPGDRVLDLAAAPGGKSTLLATLMQNRGEVACVEPVKDRFHRLKRNLEQQEVSIAKTFMKDGRGVGSLMGPVFDKVMLDAPCSSESRFHINDPKSWAFWSERKIKEMSKVQKRLLESALNALKPGGAMIYCTCSFAPEENEIIIDQMMKKWSGQIQILPIGDDLHTLGCCSQEGLTTWEGKPLNPEISKCRRILPDALWDGFFLCHIQKV